MSEFFVAAGISDIREGTMKKVTVSGHWILLAMVQGRYYAVDALCPHLKGDLSEGTLHETTLTCPLHHSQFDLRDGHVIRWTDLTGIRLTFASQQSQPQSLKHFPVLIDGDKILIALEKF